MKQSISQNGLNLEDCEGRSEQTERNSENFKDTAHVTHQIQKIIGCPISVLNVHR